MEKEQNGQQELSIDFTLKSLERELLGEGVDLRKSEGRRNLP